MTGSSGELFDDLPAADTQPAPPLKATEARARRPNRNQIELPPATWRVCLRRIIRHDWCGDAEASVMTD